MSARSSNARRIMGVPVSSTPATAGQVYSLVGGVWTPGAAGSGDVAHTRLIATDGTTLTGGGDLSADRTLSILNAGVDYTQLAADVLQFVQVLVTAAQIKALVETPVTILAAPGANKFIQVDSAIAILNYGTTTYTAGQGGNGLYFGSGSGPQAAGGFGNSVATMKATASTLWMVAGTAYFGAQPFGLALWVNQPIVWTSFTTDFATGDSTVLVKLLYRVLSTT